MSQFLGHVPVFRDPISGQIMADPNALGALAHGGGEVGAFRPFGFLAPQDVRRERRLAALDERQERLAAREARLRDRWGLADPEELVAHAPAAARTLDSAKRAGVINQNSWNGLGSTSVAAGSTGTLSQTINRIGWVKGLMLQPATAGAILVTSLTIAGIPVQIGSGGAPAELFATNTTRFSEEFSSRMVAFGQTIEVGLSNISGGAVTVGGVVLLDEASPQAFSRMMENMVLSALV